MTRPPRTTLRALAAALLVLAGAACASLPFLGRDDEVWAFHAPWDPRAAASAVRAAGSIDVLVSGWVALDTASLQPRVQFADTLQLDGPRRFALVTSWLGDRFHPETIRRLAADSAALAAAARRLEGLSSGTVRYEGIVLDFEGHSPADLPALVRVGSALAAGARAGGARTVAIAVPAVDTAGYPLAPLLAFADLALVMLYDQHWAESTPGPIAAPEWARGALGQRVSEVGGSRVVAAYPLYGYQWLPDSATRVIGFEDARRLAGTAGTALARDPATATLRARMDDPRPGQRWELWVSDAGLLERLVRDARALGVRRVALWRLGLEDPAVWTGALR